MAKLILREACFKGIENAIATEFKSTPEHKAYVKQANEQIEKIDLNMQQLIMKLVHILISNSYIK